MPDTRRVVVTLIVLVLAANALSAQKVERLSLSVGGQPRTYRLFLPEGVHAAAVPLLMLLHGSGRDGSSLVGPWEGLARKERIALVAPDSFDRLSWNLAADGPDFLNEIIEAVKQQAPIDARRIYLFGHSAGGHHALSLGLLESEYFAAVAVHAGALGQNAAAFVQQARRKIPFALWQGTDDRVVPIQVVRASRDGLVKLGFVAELVELKGHTHDYYGRASEINPAAWAFLQKHTLPSDPVFQKYLFGKEASRLEMRCQ